MYVLFDSANVQPFSLKKVCMHTFFSEKYIKLLNINCKKLIIFQAMSR